MIIALGVYLFLYLPLILVVVYSFNDSKLNAEWVGFTTQWYVKLFHNEDLLIAAGNSLIIALTSALVATLLGTMAGMVLHHYPSRWFNGLTIIPITVPEILLGVSLLMFFTEWLQLSLGMLSIMLAHIAFSIGYVAIVVRSRLMGLDESLVEAARDLGASPWLAFYKVTLPLILPGVIAGGLMAFTLSIDDFVITFFTAGPGASTLPLQIYTMIKTTVTPEVNAISTLLMLVTLVLVVMASRLAPQALKG